jgi:hypothetical protein
VQVLLEPLDLFVGLVRGPAIAFLQLSGKVALVAFQAIEIVVRELAPLGLARTIHELPAPSLVP